MAQFRTHISWGALIGAGLIVFGFLYSLVSQPAIAFWIFIAVIIGSLLPDLDLDEGMPFQIVFGLLGIASGALMFYRMYAGGQHHWMPLALISLFAFAFVRFFLGYVFEQFTNHRGMFHSVPAAVLSGLVSIWFLHMANFLLGSEFLFGSSVAIGYLGHLVLDEIYSAINLHGRSILPKSSLGSALKFRSHSHVATGFFYILIILLALMLPEARSYFS